MQALKESDPYVRQKRRNLKRELQVQEPRRSKSKHAFDPVDVLLQQRAISRGPLPVQGMVHGLPDMISRNNIAFFQYIHFFQKHPEEELYRNVLPMLTGKSSTDHPRVQRLVHESIGHIPELFSLYNRH